MKLKPCPFCGEEPKRCMEEGAYRLDHKKGCYLDFAGYWLTMEEHGRKRAREWNRRARGGK
jgi:hypothetical protein